MKRKKFIEYIKKYSFESTGRINGTHETFKSPYYEFIFTIPKGKKDIKKAIKWSFEKEIKKEKNKI